MLGVVILNYNSWEKSIKCINSLLEENLNLKIYLVDNGSIKKLAGIEKKYLEKDNIKLLFNKTNLGYAAGNNIGIRQALMDGCDAILISNNDIVYRRGSVEILYHYLLQHSQVGIVGPKIILPDGQIQKECMAIKTGLKEKYLLRTKLKIFFPHYNQKYWARNHDYDHEIFQVYAVLGCCFMMSRACAEKITPLDEKTFLYEEELILGISMERAKLKTIYNPHSEVFHEHEGTTGGIRKNPFAYTCQICSEIYYCKTYLNANNVQIYPLFIYRTLLYIFYMIKSEKFKQYWRIYKKETKKWLHYTIKKP